MSRGALAFLARLLPLDARGRRAVDEVVADWRHEVGVCDSRPSRALTHARFAVAMLQVLVLATARTMAAALVRGVIPLALMWVLLFYAAASAVGGGLFSQIHSLPANVRPILIADGFVSYLVQNMPMALFFVALSGAGRSTSAPSAGISGLGAGIAILVVASWILPFSNQHYRAVVAEALGSATVPTRGLAEMSLVELAADGSWLAVVHILVRVGLAVSCPVLVWMAVPLRSLSRLRRWIFAAVAVLAYIAGAYLVLNLLPKPVYPCLFPAIVALLMMTPLARRELVA